MANKYKDEKGHWTNKENDGGPCHHDEGGSKESFDDDYEEEFKSNDESAEYKDFMLKARTAETDGDKEWLENQAQMAYEDGKISQGQLDDVILALRERENSRRKSSEFDDNNDELTPEENARFDKKGEIVKKYQEMGYDPSTAQMKAEKDVLNEEIRTALDDNSWSITGNTTIGQYAQEVADKVGTFKENVIKVIEEESGRTIDENAKMLDAMGAADSDFDNDESQEEYEARIKPEADKFKKQLDDAGYKLKDKEYGLEYDKEDAEKFKDAGFDVASEDEVNEIFGDKNKSPYDDERPGWDPAKDEHFSEYDKDVKAGDYSDDEINDVIRLAEEYGKNATRGFITQDEMKMIADRMGLKNLSDRDLRLAWNKYYNILGRESHRGGSMKRFNTFGDAQSAFAEVINQEARNRKATGNYFPYNDEDIQVGRDRIAELARPHESYDADSPEGYMSADELRQVENLANQYHLTDDDLAKISRMFDKNFGYGGRGWKNPTHAKLKEFGYSDEEISKMSPEDIKIAADFFARFNNPKPRR